MTKQFQSILFLSTGRTGTKFLASILRNTVPNADVFHEAGERSRLINILSHSNLAGATPFTFIIKAWESAIEKPLKASQGTRDFYIDANNHIYYLVVNKPELYPALKVIHIVRDPRTYIRSHLNWSHSRGKSFLANYLTPFWQPAAYMVGEMKIKDWLRLSKLERFAWVWNFKNLYINKVEDSAIPYLRIRFEDLFSAEDAVLTFQRIIEFLGLKDLEPDEAYFQKAINVSKSDHLPEWTQWSTQMCNKVDQICRAGMTKFGYGNEPEWIDRISQSGETS